MSATAVRAMAAEDTDTDAGEDGVNPSTHFEWAVFYNCGKGQ